jgi:hypothetical protein
MNSQEQRWYLSRDGQQHGPFSDADLVNFARLGQLQENDLIWRDGFENWRPAMTIFPKPQPTPTQVSPANKPVRVRAVQQAVERPVRRAASGLTWTKALIALACSAAIGAAGGYVYKHAAGRAEPMQSTGRS